MPAQRRDEAARQAWQAKIGEPSDLDRASTEPAGLAAPRRLRAVPGRAQITLRWDPVPGGRPGCEFSGPGRWPGLAR